MDNESGILELYEQVEMNKGTTNQYNKLLREYMVKKDKFVEKLTEEQQEELEDVLQANGELDIQEMKEYFVEGFKIATKLLTDTFYKEKISK